MKRLLVASTVALAGCPSSYGFHAHVLTPQAPVETIELAPEGHVVPGQLVPVANATITCTGCDKPPTIDDKGHVFVPLDGNRKVTLQIEAAGYRTAIVEITEPMTSSQVGYGHTIVVLGRNAPSP